MVTNRGQAQFHSALPKVRLQFKSCDNYGMWLQKYCIGNRVVQNALQHTHTVRSHSAHTDVLASGLAMYTLLSESG